MGRHLQFQPHVPLDELERRYRTDRDPHEHVWWQVRWLLSQGHTARELAKVTGYSAYWIGQIAKRYNANGPAGMTNRQRTRSRQTPPLLSVALQEELRQALARSAPEDDRWSGRMVADWMTARLGRPVSRYRGWVYLSMLKPKSRQGAPRPRHALADAEQQEACKSIRSQVQAVATAFPGATVELWATDEHRIGLKPLLRRVWTPAGPRPHAVVQHRFAWRWLVGFVHPASGRTVFHLAPSVSLELFEVELAAFARVVGASPLKQIVFVLDRAGWHASARLQVPDHVHLLFLPPYSPELQPAEHLWPLTNTVLINRHFIDLEEFEDAQARRCIALQRRRDLIRSAPRFRWWPLRIKKRQGPRAL